MSFETRITRQTIPCMTHCPVAVVSHGVKQVYPTDGMATVELVPPDDGGEWRYREMQLLPAFVAAGSSAIAQPTEIIVIWEKYKENE